MTMRKMAKKKSVVKKIFSGAIGTISVSYTHLDVYKRQLIFFIVSSS